MKQFNIDLCDRKERPSRAVAWHSSGGHQSHPRLCECLSKAQSLSHHMSPSSPGELAHPLMLPVRLQGSRGDRAPRSLCVMSRGRVNTAGPPISLLNDGSETGPGNPET